jgi:hypothetical protein
MKYSRSLVATLLMSGGLLQLAPLALAAGTAAGQPIENTATATYEDPSGAVSNTTSNTVTVTVAEVAGITITAGTVTNTGGTAVTDGTPTAVTTPLKAGDNLVFEFDVTNIGNDTTNFVLPNQAQVGNSPATVQKVQYFDKSTNTWKDVSTLAGGIITKNSTDDGTIAPGSVVKVRVLATVNAGTTTGAINVTYGSTGQVNRQNDPFAPTGGDVYTSDIAGSPTGETAGVPSNGVREAAATGTTVVNPGSQAFVKVTKVAGAVDPGTTPTDITDDKVTYTLGVDVLDTAPPGTNLLAADLAGTEIKIDGALVPRILVSDAIPAGTTLASAPTALSGWTVVYTTSAIGATAANDPSIAWTTTTPLTPAAFAAVTRVGFVKSGTILKADPALTGFTLTINLKLPSTGGSVLNIAQAFGTTLVNGLPDPTKPAVDESGDAQANNLNPDGTAGPTPTNGVATGADGIDTAKDNTGSGTGGEATIVTVTPPAPPAGTVGILNGPENKPAATGPSGLTNDDFTNKSVTIDTTQAKWIGGVPTPVDPQSTGFTNSVSQAAAPTNVTARPQFVSLLPTAPANRADLPTGTIVKIIAGGVTNTYTYDSGTGVFTPAATSTTPITLLVPISGSVPYGVEVDLPAGSAQLKGFPVSITSFANGAPAVVNPTTGLPVTDPNNGNSPMVAIVGNNTLDATDAQNVTIDRLYTGYVKLEKEAQVYKTVGGVTTIVSPFAAAAPKAEPGEYIEYRIKYSNISEIVPTGSNSVGLAANNIKILENGAANSATGTTNNWAAFTEHKPASAQDNQGAIVYEGGAKTNGDLIVNDYLDTVPTLAPGAVGQFTFTRQVK